MICLSESDMHEAVTFDEVMDAVEAALKLYETKDFHNPLRTHVDYQGNTLLLMPCFTRKSFGTKLVSLFPGNEQKELPTLYGIMVLNDIQSGKPLAILNGSVLTSLRTGAVGGVSIRHLTPDSVHTAGIVGTGVQGFHQALFACRARNITDLYLFDLAAYNVSFCMEKLAPELPEVKLHQVNSIDQLVEESQIVITTTTSNMPVLPNKEKLLAKKHFVGIGSYRPNMREFPQALFKQLRRVYVDTNHALDESGDLIEPLKHEYD
ncbi:ornithine cyclodeaminase family protein [Planctomycetota bacterium]